MRNISTRRHWTNWEKSLYRQILYLMQYYRLAASFQETIPAFQMTHQMKLTARWNCTLISISSISLWVNHHTQRDDALLCCEMAAFYSCYRPNLIVSHGWSCTRLIKSQDLLSGFNVPDFFSANSLVLPWHQHQITFRPACFWAIPHLGLCTVQRFEAMAATLSCRLNAGSERQDGMETATREQKNGGKNNLCLTSLENVC